MPVGQSRCESGRSACTHARAARRARIHPPSSAPSRRSDLHSAAHLYGVIPCVACRLCTRLSVPKCELYTRRRSARHAVRRRCQPFVYPLPAVLHLRSILPALLHLASALRCRALLQCSRRRRQSRRAAHDPNPVSIKTRILVLP